MLLAPAGLSTSMLPPLPSPLSISELTSLPPLPYYATGPRHQRQEAPQPATLQAPPVDPFPHTEPDLKSGDARDRNIRMIIMKNLDGTDFFSNSDKLFNYSAFRKINIFLLARDCPALNPEPAGNGLISTTETMFVFKDASDVQSVLAAWRMRPVELHNLRIYEGGSTGHQQNTPAQSTLQEIMALDVPSSSRGRGTLRGTYRTSRGSGGGRGRGGWY
ncbi:hypothetical protein M407DRAFT_246573 [Tulasnella calospora MUT 4182]|uniref:Uncharacterized protein n=2 Tax=Tulasnella calospora MUT 4182 TaxID=1051891 RepID=A0A0C3PTI2_9AGAM|nr:hypothetical protein M407DRAFT_246573 [Tulasnella calospora MUT 4182]